MRFYADLHVHSKYSRATSKDGDLENLSIWAQRKGLAVIATSDFTHPAWMEELKAKLVPAEPGLMRLRPEIEREVEQRVPAPCRRPVRFMASVEISTIYKRDGATRKIHHLIYAPDLETADRLRLRLNKIGNLSADGRPILGLDSRDLLEITLECGPGTFLVPAHIWTPWFAVLGSKSGFDSVDACYADLAGHIFAVETGLSSDPAMNWRVSALDKYRLISNSDAHSGPMLGREACVFDCDLDYYAMRRALETGQDYGGTLEFFPEEGKYHLDGHRLCNVRFEPGTTREHAGICPACGKPLTVGVMHRVEMLADRGPGEIPANAAPFANLVPLAELVSEIKQVGAKSGAVTADVGNLAARLGPELSILRDLELDDIRQTGSQLLAEAIKRVRQGLVRREAGYDGEYGVIRVFDAQELGRGRVSGTLFDFGEAPAATPVHEAKKKTRRQASGPDLSALTAPPSVTPSAASEKIDHSGPVARPRSLNLLRDLDADQREAASLEEGPLLIIAGPGTGKTRTVTYRFAHLVAECAIAPEQCLAITFTRRAAQEMQARLDSLLPDQSRRMQVTTFHGFGLGLLRDQHARLGLPADFRIADAPEKLALAQEMEKFSPREAQCFLDELSLRKRTDRPAQSDCPQARYEQELRRRGLVDFDDLLAMPVKLLEEDSRLAVAYSERFSRIAIDEYQDIDELQYRLVRALTSTHQNICAVGDPDQSIYRFRGADVGFFMRFENDFPGTRKVQLTRNYRSSSTIVSGALQAIAPQSLVPSRQLRAMREQQAPCRIAWHEAEDERAEAYFVTRVIEQLLGGASHYAIDTGLASGTSDHSFSFSDFAVLYRTDAQANALVESLQRGGMVCQKRSHDRLLDRPGVRNVARALKEQPSSSTLDVWSRVRDWCTAVGKETDQTKGTCGSDTSVLGGTDETRQDEGQSMASAMEVLEPLAKSCGHDLAQFLDTLALGAEVDALDPRADRVSLLTLHAAKGLEYPVVFIVGCEDGLLPLRFADQADHDSKLAEERRLFFVGLTRACSHLFLCRARKRMRHGKIEQTVKSPFVEDLSRELLAEVQNIVSTRRSQPAARQLDLFRKNSR